MYSVARHSVRASLEAEDELTDETRFNHCVAWDRGTLAVAKEITQRTERESALGERIHIDVLPRRIGTDGPQRWRTTGRRRIDR